MPVFGYKNHLGIDRRHGFIRSFTVTDAAAHDGRQLGRLLDPDNTASGVWADTAYRSATNVALLARRGLVPQLERPKLRGKPMPPHITRGNATRARVRVAIEHVFELGIGRALEGTDAVRLETVRGQIRCTERERSRIASSPFRRALLALISGLDRVFVAISSHLLVNDTQVLSCLLLSGHRIVTHHAG